MDEARVAPVHELQLETPIELTRLRRQRTLEIDYQLVQQRFVHSIVKEPSKVLVICRAGRIESDPIVDPTGNLKARFRSERSCFGFAGYGRRSETKSKREIEKLSHGLAGTIQRSSSSARCGRGALMRDAGDYN